jgi:hypothetical protein
MAKKTSKKKAATRKTTRKAATKTTAKTARAKKSGAKARATKRASGLDLAAKMLADSKEPLNAKDITERVIKAGWKTSGKTPHATLYAAIVREITKKGKDARFVKRDRGLFAARKGA